MKKTDEECIGCCMSSSCELEPSFIIPNTNKTVKCPCIDCLVKTMCDVYSLCNKYREYRNTIRQYREYKIYDCRSQIKSESQG